MDLTLTESLENSILKPIYDHENTLNSDAFKKADESGADTGPFYPGMDEKRTIPGSNIPFYSEAAQKNLAKGAEVTKEFFSKNLPDFLLNIPEDAIYGVFKGLENGVGATQEAFPGIKPLIDTIAEKNLAPDPFNLTLKDVSKKVHNLSDNHLISKVDFLSAGDGGPEKTWANNLTEVLFQAAPYLFLARSKLLQGGFGVKKANLLAWMFASGMGFKNEELLVSDIYAKALNDSKFLV